MKTKRIDSEITALLMGRQQWNGNSADYSFPIAASCIE